MVTAGGWSQGREQSRRPEVGALDPCFEPVAIIRRGRSVESVHRGAVAVVDAEGELLGAVGDPGTEVLLRSSAKPFQAAAAVAAGVADAFSLSDEEIAVMAASHSGAPQHVEVVNRLLARAELPAPVLVCGSLEHNCSGKHAGMLLFARHLGVSERGYHRQEHPVQREIGAYIASLLEGPSARPRATTGGASAKPGSRALFAGTDGCGVPVLGMTVYEAASLFALLAAGATPALARVRDAMLAHPFLVAGEGRLDTNLMRAGAGGIVCKAGAEGVQGIGLLNGGATRQERADGPVPLGCAMKVEDGSGRPIPVVVAAFLRAWGLGKEAVAVEHEHPPGILDQTGTEVARIEVLVEPAGLRHSINGARVKEEHPAGGAAPAARWLLGGKGDHVTISRGDEKDVLRFLREQWPAVDREYFGRAVEWAADPYALIYRRDRKVVGVLKGHFIGGLASVDELIVGESSRGSGLGSLLLGRFEEEARRRHCSRIVLRAVKGSRAEDFYRRRGYHRECVQYGYEFGYDYVRLICDVEQALGESGGAVGETKGG